MKKVIRLWLAAWALGLTMTVAQAQKIDDERMKRDIEVAENVLATLIKQEMNSQKGWWGVDVRGSYLPGYGVTFRIPGDHNMPFLAPGADVGVWDVRGGEGYTYTIRSDGRGHADADCEDCEEDAKKALSLKEKAKERRKVSVDSMRNVYKEKIIQASKDFILDYGDFVSQLGANEKVVVTNQGERRGFYYPTQKRSHISVEGTKADITAFKQGKLTREQALGKLKVVNTESVDEKKPDLELLSSIIGRLYRADLSKTYFTEDNIYYESLRDYGSIFYMQVYSSNGDTDRVIMPTQGETVITKAERDKKVVELYPKFEQDLKENMIEYGRTLKSLKPEENLVFNVTLTKCKGCNIPSTAEFSVKGSTLQEYNTGKIDKSTAVSRVSVKKGPNQ